MSNWNNLKVINNKNLLVNSRHSAQKIFPCILIPSLLLFYFDEFAQLPKFLLILKKLRIFSIEFEFDFAIRLKS